VKTAIFFICGSNNWKTVENRWVHAATQFVSIEFSFHPYTTFSVIAPGASPGETKMWAAERENGRFFNCCKLHNFITVVNYTSFAAIIDSFMSN